MSDGDDGKRLTRRRLLAGVGGASTLGLVGGAGTRAFLRDTESVPGSLLGNPYEGTHLDLKLRCGGSGGVCTADADGVSFAFEGVTPPAGGSTEVRLGVSGGPAWLWFRALSSTVDSLVGNELLVTLAYIDGDGNRRLVTDPANDRVEDRPLNDLVGTFDAGGMLPGAAGPDGAFGETEERSLELSWSLPKPDPGLSGQSVAFTLRFAAVQYRSDVPDVSTTNPWREQ